MNTMRNLTSLSLALILVSGSIACEANNSQGQASVESTAALRERQELSYVSIGDTRKLLAHSLHRFYRTKGCQLNDFTRIDIESAAQLISQVYFPEQGQSEEAIDFLLNNSNQIVALLGTVESEVGHSTLLRLVYQPSLDYIPDFLGCSDGILFDLTKLGVIDPTISDDDDPGEPPSPTACMMTFGQSGPCCHCSAMWTGEDGCNQSYDCQQGECCDGSSEANPDNFVDEFCPQYGEKFFLDDTPIEKLPYGKRL